MSLHCDVIIVYVDNVHLLKADSFTIQREIPQDPRSDVILLGSGGALTSDKPTASLDSVMVFGVLATFVSRLAYSAKNDGSICIEILVTVRSS